MKFSTNWNTKILKTLVEGETGPVFKKMGENTIHGTVAFYLEPVAIEVCSDHRHPSDQCHFCSKTGPLSRSKPIPVFPHLGLC